MQDTILKTDRGDMTPFFYTPLVTLISINHTLSRGKNVDSGHFCHLPVNFYFGDICDASISILSMISQGIIRLIVLPFCIKSDTLFFFVTVSTFMMMLNGVTPCLLRKLSTKIINHSVNPVNRLLSTEMLFVFVGTLKGILHGCLFPFGGCTPSGTFKYRRGLFVFCAKEGVSVLVQQGKSIYLTPTPPSAMRKQSKLTMEVNKYEKIQN